MPAVKKPAPQATRLVEELEYSNVTNFRDTLLAKVGTFCANPAKRYVITKHGQPQAVLMSFQTYSLLTKVMDRELARTTEQEKADPVQAAFARMGNENDESAANPAEADSPADSQAVSIVLETLRGQIDQLGAAYGVTLRKR